ncbi:MAG: diphthine--ammonia ligase [Candidatus Altiarchaeota archaeon]
MKLGVLFSGGKDSTLALQKAMQKEEIACLITVASKNPESYMFHTPNIDVTRMQAESIGLPLVRVETSGQKELELVDLSKAIIEAKKEHRIEGVVTGAIESVYQAERIQRICDKLDLWCHNPLWKLDQENLLRQILENQYRVIISGVFAHPLDDSWLGREIRADTITELVKLREKFQISPSGEGGEIETTVLDAPFFKKRIEITKAEKKYALNSGTYDIIEARTVEK